MYVHVIYMYVCMYLILSVTWLFSMTEVPLDPKF